MPDCSLNMKFLVKDVGKCSTFCNVCSFVGTELGFSAKSYKYDEGLTIIITSTRVQIGFKLNKLVSLNCDPKDALTLNGKDQLGFGNKFRN